ncbi:MAG: hypothetical protein ACTSU2_05370, partial [Promethearchaeota archaeon]
MTSYLAFLGVLFLLFRIWLAEFKLKEELEFRKRYVSRILTYYFGLGMICEFKNVVFNLILASSLFMMIISFVGWDILFFIKFPKRTYWKKNKGWIIIERLTMHPPLITVGILMYMNNIQNYVGYSVDVWAVISAFTLVFLPFLTIDKRWTEKYIKPTGMNILIGSLISMFVV